MYEFRPSKTNKASEYVSILLIFTALTAMLFTTIPSLPYRSFMQLAAVLVLCAALIILGRYVFRGYLYAVVKRDDGGYDFTVTELRRRSRITVCRIGLEGIEELLIFPESGKKQIKEKRLGRKSFNYSVDLSPAKYCTVLCEECGESFAIKLSFDEKLCEILSSAASVEGSEDAEE